VTDAISYSVVSADVYVASLAECCETALGYLKLKVNEIPFFIIYITCLTLPL
jgi:hypothetical protein